MSGATVATEPPGSPRTLRRDGMAAFRQGDHARALALLQQAVERREADAQLHQDLGGAALALGHFGKAAEAYAAALALDPGRVDAMRGLGHCARRQGDPATALKHFQEACTADGTQPKHHCEAGEALRSLDRPDEAADAFARALALDRRFRPALLSLAAVSRAQGDHARALHLLETAEEIGPSDPGVAVDIARIRIALGADKESAFQPLLVKPETRHGACLELSREARRAGDLPRAIDWLARAVEVGPPDRPNQLALADLHRQAWQLDSADRIYDAFLALHPADGDALVGKGLVARSRGQRPEARRFFEAACVAEATAGESELGRELREQGDSVGARIVFERLRSKRPDDPAVLVQLGLAAQACDDHAGALRAFDDAIAVAPTHVSAFIEKAATLRRLGRVAEMRSVLIRAEAARPDHPRVSEALGDLALASEDLGRARDLFGRAAADPSLASPALKLARVEALLGRIDSALAMLEALSARRGPSPDTVLLKAQILKQCGRLPAAAAAFADGTTRFPLNFPLWLQAALFEAEWTDGSGSPAACEGAPATTPAEIAKVELIRGARAAAAWNFRDAKAHYAVAADHNPSDSAVQGRVATAALLTLDLQEAEKRLRLVAGLETSTRRLRGQALGPFQSLTGQILDEARLDAAGLDRLSAAVRGTEPALQLAAILAVVRTHPDMTVAAMQAMLTMRRAGYLDRGRACADGISPIPSTIVQFWNTEVAPEDVVALCRTWPEQHPAVAYRLYSERDARQLLAADCDPRVGEAFRRARDPARKADVFRLAYLLRFGGLYADADDRCLAPLADLLGTDAALVLYQEDIGSIGNNIMAAAPGHPLIRRALDLAVGSVLGGDTDIPWLATGPGLLTRVLAEAAAEGRFTPETGNVRIVTRRELLPFVATCCMTGYKSTRRHWSRAAFMAPRPRPERTALPPSQPPEILNQRTAS